MTLREQGRKKAQARSAYRKAQARHLASIPPMDAETWGLWHDHTCIDCSTTYACQAAHGKKLAAESKTRCDGCFEKRFF